MNANKPNPRLFEVPKTCKVNTAQEARHFLKELSPTIAVAPRSYPTP